MLKFLFGKTTPGKATSGKSASGATTPAAVEAPAPLVETVPLADRLAALAGLADGDPGIVDTALASGPQELREAALARIVAPAELVRIACEARSADTRHAAALRIDDESLLAQVAQSTRTRDKRVYKLARERLDGFARERERLALQARWLETVEHLAAQEQPELTRVMEVERVWAALHADADADQRFQAARARLHARFQAQAEERRAARQAVSPGAQALASAAAPTAGAAGASAATSAAGDDPVPPGADAQAAGSAASGRMPAAPAGMPGDDSAAATSSAGDGAVPNADASGDALPVGAAAEVSADATAAVATSAPRGRADGTAAAASSKAARRPAPDPALRDEIARLLEGLEQALEDGHVHEAETLLETLSGLQSRAGGVAGALGGRIRRAVEEIARLRAWRRWGGQQARDHLCDAAEALPARALPPEELGRAIKALRAQWQAIAQSEGGAPQHLWERFDAACEKAWEPVREHFARQAERRSENLKRREAMLAELEARVAALDAPPVDWKAAAIQLADAGRRWRTLGPVDRKVSKTLEARFSAAAGTLERRLRLVREAEAAEREALIRRAEQLAERVDGRDTVTRLRELQAEWQVRSRAVSLDRAREQALWERFRTVCDGLFQARDAVRAAEDAERTAQAEAEAAAFRKRSEQWRSLREGALACAAAEQALLQTTDAETLGRLGGELEARWAALPDAGGREVANLLSRRNRVLAACAGTTDLADFQSALKAGDAAQGLAVLELEIGLGLPSPAELQETRRRVQLERLADALRSGGRSDQEGLRRTALELVQRSATTATLAQRVDAILAALAPQAPERRATSARPPREERSASGREGGRGEGRRSGRDPAAPARREGTGRPARSRPDAAAAPVDRSTRADG